MSLPNLGRETPLEKERLRRLELRVTWFRGILAAGGLALVAAQGYQVPELLSLLLVYLLALLFSLVSLFLIFRQFFHLTWWFSPAPLTWRY